MRMGRASVKDACKLSQFHWLLGAHLPQRSAERSIAGERSAAQACPTGGGPFTQESGPMRSALTRCPGRGHASGWKQRRAVGVF
jgi:hypothetical protein